MIKTSIFLICFNLLFIATQAQFSSKRVNKVASTNQLYSNVNKGEFYDLTNLLPKGYVKDGTIDYTQYIQKGLAKYNKVKMPNFPVLTTGIYLKSNSEVFFESKSRLIMKPTKDGRYRVVGIHGLENVKVYNANITGDRKKHLGSSGEWGYGIEIKASRNIKIYNASVNECWGDGIIITESMSDLGKNIKGKPISNIELRGVNLDYNRRNGVTVTSVENLIIENAIITNTMGASPKAAIMIEPDRATAKLNNLTFRNIKVNNCPLGIGINLTKFSNSSRANSISLILDQIQIHNTITGIQIAGFKSKPNKKVIGGGIQINNVSLTSNDRDFVRSNGFGITPNVKISNIKVFKGGKLIQDKSTILKNVSDKKSIIFN